MRLGLVTDIHNHAPQLARAIALFQQHGVDQVLTLGDSCDAFCFPDQVAETARLLHSSRAIGVWGNHDFCFCRDFDVLDRSKYPESVLEVMSTMQPRLEIEHCLFSHKNAAVDPFDVAQLWDFGDENRDLWSKASAGFRASPSRWQFVGHYHRWWAATEDGPLDWHGTETLKFAPGQRYFIVVAAVMNGSCAILDLDAAELQPLSCAAG